jgi:hypothetical protein
MVTGICITKTTTFGTIFIILLSLTLTGCLTDEDGDEDGSSYLGEIILKRTMSIETSRPIDYTYNLSLPEDKIINDITVQNVVSIDTTPAHAVDDTGSQPQMRWEGHLDGGNSLDIEIKYHIKTNEIIWDIDRDTSGTISDIPTIIHNGYDKNLFLRDAWPVKDYNDDPGVDSDSDGITDEQDVDDDNDGKVDKYRIEPSNPEIQDLLDDILIWAGISNSGLTSDLNVWNVADAIYRYLRTSENKIEYPTSAESQSDYYTYGGLPKWATACFDDKRGDCDDQSILFISLCRAAGIPAWMESGFLYNGLRGDIDGHGWANILVPLKNSGFKTPEVDVAGSQFFARNAGRFTEWIDDCIPGKFGTGTDQHSWLPGSLEEHYISWRYTYTGSPPSIQTSEKIELVKCEVK